MQTYWKMREGDRVALAASEYFRGYVIAAYTEYSGLVRWDNGENTEETVDSIEPSNNYTEVDPTQL